MSKGYNNFMSKKAFHPGSYANQKRIHEAEEKAEAKRKHDEETLAQYQKEQELFNQKSLVSKLSKEKLSLNFMYETPAGVEKPNDKPLEWKGSSSGASKTSTSSSSKPFSTNSGCSGSSSKASANICLEWKRDRPVKKSNQHQKQEQQQRHEQNVKQETVKIEPKVEPLSKQHQQQHMDLKWARKREVTSHPPSHHVNREQRHRVKEEEKDIKPDVKRIKKER